MDILTLLPREISDLGVHVMEWDQSTFLIRIFLPASSLAALSQSLAKA